MEHYCAGKGNDIPFRNDSELCPVPSDCKVVIYGCENIITNKSQQNDKETEQVVMYGYGKGKGRWKKTKRIGKKV